MLKLEKNQKKKKVERPLSKAEREQIKKRIAQINQSKNRRKNFSTQSILPYNHIYSDGICDINGNDFSKTIEFFDINYSIADFEEKNHIFSKYSDILNYFDSSIKVQLTFDVQNASNESIKQMVHLEPQYDGYDDLREEYEEILSANLQKGCNGRIIRRFITVTVKSKDLHQAKIKLNGICKEICDMFRSMDVESKTLDGKERLEMMYRSLNPQDTDDFIFDWTSKVRNGLSSKDFVAPQSCKFFRDRFMIGRTHGAVKYLNILANEISDDMLNEYLNCLNGNVSFNLFVTPIDIDKAIKTVQSKLISLKSAKAEQQKKAAQSGYGSDIINVNLEADIEEMERQLEALKSKDEGYFTATITIRHYADSKTELIQQTETLKRITSKNSCRIFTLDYEQEQALGDSLPIGINHIDINRNFTTPSLAVFMPFRSKELFMWNGIYYGINQITKNIIKADRKMLKNPNGLYLGVPGGGKSFAIKREILDVFLRLKDDIYICDPEAEYFPLVNTLGGQVIRISADSTDHINLMDVPLDISNIDEDIIGAKSEYIMSICEIIVSGRYELDSEEKSVIDRCVRNIYNRFYQNPSMENMPLLEDLYNELKEAGRVVSRVTNSLELYVHGSQNVFNHPTNVDINNRTVCFDISKLKGQLRSLGMLVINELVWNRVAQNRGEKSTRYYIDEFHLLLNYPQTAEYCVELWKRLRKWGGIPTGITQNVKDFLGSRKTSSIVDNSDFIYLLNQSAGDREIISNMLHISDEQLKYVTDVDVGNGLICYGGTIIPFKDEFPKDTKMYLIMSSKAEDLKKQLELFKQKTS